MATNRVAAKVRKHLFNKKRLWLLSIIFFLSALIILYYIELDLPQQIKYFEIFPS